MEPVARDAMLATVSAVGLLAVLAVTDSMVALARPSAATVGILVALGVEWLFLAETPAADLWDRRSVRVWSVAALLVSAGVVAVSAGPWLLAVAWWGIATYFTLLGLLVAGVWTPAAADTGPANPDDGDESR